MSQISITESIKYIGVDDIDLDLFESQYSVPEGISYNSYLIIDDKIAILDTVDHRKCDEWWEKLEDALDGHTPHYLIVHHAEPDHAGSIASTMERYPHMQVVASTRAIQLLSQFFPDTDFTHRSMVVREGDTLSLGHHTLLFAMAPMVHWPEVMITYDMTDKIAFTADAFGSFGALHSSGKDTTTGAKHAWPDEARRYYYNVCGKYGIPVQNLLKRLSKMELNVICPLHGPVLSTNLNHYIDLYDQWSRYIPERGRILIAYASIHGNTAAVATHMAHMLAIKGAKEVITIDLSRADMSEAVTEAFRAERLLLAASSYDASVFPPMHDFLHHLHLKGFQHRRIGIIENGSWAPAAGRTIKEMLHATNGITIVEPMVTIRSTMRMTDQPALDALAEALLHGRSTP